MGLYSKITDKIGKFYCEHVILIALILLVATPFVHAYVYDASCEKQQAQQTNIELDTLQINDSTYVINAIYYHCDKMTAVKIKEFTK